MQQFSPTQQRKPRHVRPPPPQWAKPCISVLQKGIGKNATKKWQNGYQVTQNVKRLPKSSRKRKWVTSLMPTPLLWYVEFTFCLGAARRQSEIGTLNFLQTMLRILPEIWKIRYRPKGVFGKGVGNSKNASEMRQKWVKDASKLLGKEERSKMRQKCVKNARNTFGGEHLLDATKKCAHKSRP